MREYLCGPDVYCNMCAHPHQRRAPRCRGEGLADQEARGASILRQSHIRSFGAGGAGKDGSVPQTELEVGCAHTHADAHTYTHRHAHTHNRQVTRTHTGLRNVHSSGADAWVGRSDDEFQADPDKFKKGWWFPGVEVRSHTHTQQRGVHNRETHTDNRQTHAHCRQTHKSYRGQNRRVLRRLGDEFRGVQEGGRGEGGLLGRVP